MQDLRRLFHFPRFAILHHHPQEDVVILCCFQFDTELKAAQDYDIFLRMVVEYGEPWKVEEATQILHINHGEMQITSSPKKFSGYFHFYRKHKDKFDRASKKYQLFTLYQIRNKRMTWRTLLTLLSVRNGKRLADGIRGR